MSLGPKRLDQFPVPVVITGNEYIGMQYGDKTLSAQLVQVASSLGVLANALTKPEASAPDGATRIGTPEGTVQDALDGRLTKAAAAAPDGSTKIGNARTAVADLVTATVGAQLSALEVSIWEFVGSVVKPNPTDPTTWTWTTAFAVAQAAVNALGGGTIKLPKGITYYLDGSGISTITSASGYQMNPAIRFLGEGDGTIISRRETLATDVPDRADPATFNQSAFNLYGSYHRVENLFIKDCKTAIYMGQKTGEVDTCNVSFCKVASVFIANCGMGVHMRSGVGNYYNTLEDMHVFQCQIGEYMDVHPSSLIVAANNNRNQIRMLRNARNHVGLWIVRGDTNQLVGLHGEGNTATPTNNRYAAPTGIPYGAGTGIAQLLETNATNNSFVACMNESNVLDLINGGVRNSFSGLYGDESGKVRHIVRPYFYSTQTMSVTECGNTFWFANAQPDIFATYAAGREHHDIAVEFHAETWQTNGDAWARSRLVDAGTVAANAALNVTLWPEVEGPTTNNRVARFKVAVVGNCQADGLVIATDFTVIAFRVTSRTLTGYYVYDVVSGRATGAGTGDAVQPFVPTLSAGGAGGKDLILTLTAPARVFVGVAVAIDRVMR